MKKHNDLPKCIKVWKILKLTNIFNINEQRSQKYGFIVYDWILISVAQDVTFKDLDSKRKENGSYVTSYHV